MVLSETVIHLLEPAKEIAKLSNYRNITWHMPESSFWSIYYTANNARRWMQSWKAGGNLEFCYLESHLHNSNSTFLDLRWLHRAAGTSWNSRNLKKNSNDTNNLTLAHLLLKIFSFPKHGTKPYCRTTSMKLHHHLLKAKVDLILHMNSRVTMNRSVRQKMF